MKFRHGRGKSRFIEIFSNYLKYTLSLPERTIRSLAALAGGASTLLTGTLFPESVRGTTLYSVSLGMMQRFIIEKVALMEGEVSGPSRDIGRDFLVRKMAGTALEAAGLLTIRLSPLWVLAVAADTAGGGRVFLERLVLHLKNNGVISPETEARQLIDVLEAVQDASSTSALSVDTPPLTRAQLAESVMEMKTSYSRVFRTSANLLPRLDSIWDSMVRLSKSEGIPIERLCGIITVDAVAATRRGAGFLYSSGRAGAELIDEKILDSYRSTLDAVSRQGVESYMSSHMQPFMKSAKSHFSPERGTWIEKTISRITRR